MSRPTEIMFVAMATSTCSFSWNRIASRRLASATLFVDSREVSSTTSKAMVRLAKVPSVG